MVSHDDVPVTSQNCPTRQTRVACQAELEEEHRRLVKERQAEKAALQAELAREDKEAQEQAKAQKSESPKAGSASGFRRCIRAFQAG